MDQHGFQTRHRFTIVDGFLNHPCLPFIKTLTRLINLKTKAKEQRTETHIFAITNEHSTHSRYNVGEACKFNTEHLTQHGQAIFHPTGIKGGLCC